MEVETEEFIESYKIGKRLITFLKRYEWILLIGLTIISWVLGFIGFSIYFSEQDVTKSFTDLVYITFQLFTFESGYVDGRAPLILDIARFLAPFTLVYAAFAAFMWFINQQFKLLRLKRFKNHTVFIGLGKQAFYVLKNMQDKDEKTVVLTPEELAPWERTDHRNTVFISANFSDNKVLTKVRIEHAKQVICMAEDENQNLSSGLMISDYLRLNVQKAKTKLFVLTTPILVEHFQDLDFDDKASGNHNFFGHQIHFFTVYERAARLLAQKYAPDRFADFSKESEIQPHILIAGFNEMGQALLLQVGKMFHFANRTKLKATVFYSDHVLVKDFYRKYPSVDEVIDLNFLEQTDCTKRNIKGKTGNSDVQVIFICVTDETKALEVFNTLSVFKSDTKLVFCHENSDGFSERIVRVNIDHFYVNSETLNIDSIIKEKNDRQAMLVHQSYLTKEKASNDENIKTLKKLTHLDWNNLTERTKNANRNQADHIRIKLRAAGCKTSVMNYGEALYDFSKDSELLEVLAEVEHRRWNAEQLLNGWIYGKKRNNELKIHDNIVPYSDLPDSIKKYDRDAVINIPVILAAEGEKVVKI